DSMRYREGIVDLPKLTFEDKSKLAAPLQQLGMIDAFAGGDFGAMADLPLAISEGYHQTVIDVSASGTEAAAATAVVAVATSMVLNPPPPALFRADHPFLFAIRDTHTDGILFLGRMAQPSLAPSTAVAVPEPASMTTTLFIVAAFGAWRRVCR